MDERLERNIVLALEAKKASLAMRFIKEAFEQDCECAMIQVYLGILNEIENHQAKSHASLPCRISTGWHKRSCTL